jgi:hypothetical protein
MMLLIERVKRKRADAERLVSLISGEEKYEEVPEECCEDCRGELVERGHGEVVKCRVWD